MPEKDIKILIEKYRIGTLTEEDRAFLESCYIHYAQERVSTFNVEDLEYNLSLLDKVVFDNISEEHTMMRANRLKNRKGGWLRIAAAACLVTIGASYLILNKKEEPTPSLMSIERAESDIKPGGNKAFLTLADGTKISLDDAIDGKIASQTGMVITKTKDGQLVYTVAEQKEAVHLNGYNTIETPRGGQYQINLPDGSKVWLNAQTRLKFPVTFAHQQERRVELVGEAYFEVAKISNSNRGKLPFEVVSNGQLVEVLGTHFNVNAYPDQANTVTTLLEGSVRVNSTGNNAKTTRLVPGQAASLSSQGLTTRDVDTEFAVAWKKGQFMFDGASLQEVMKEISRWYDVDVEYVAGDFSNIKIAGSVSKFSNIKVVLDILALAGKVNLKLEGNKIIVGP